MSEEYRRFELLSTDMTTACIHSGCHVKKENSWTFVQCSSGGDVAATGQRLQVAAVAFVRAAVVVAHHGAGDDRRRRVGQVVEQVRRDARQLRRGRADAGADRPGAPLVGVEGDGRVHQGRVHQVMIDVGQQLVRELRTAR